MHINFCKIGLVRRSVKPMNTNLFAKNRKLHKCATINSNFEKKKMYFDMHHHKMYM